MPSPRVCAARPLAQSLRAWLAVAAAVALPGTAAAQFTFVSEFGTSGSATGQFRFPQGVALAPSGASVYVVASGRDRALTFAAAGAFHSEFGTSGSGTGQFLSPRGVAVGPSGTVYA